MRSQASFKELNDPFFNVKFDVIIVVDLMPIPGVELCLDAVACLGKPVRRLIHAFAPVPDRVLISAYLIYR